VSDDELIYIGAAILLAPMLAHKTVDPTNDPEIRTAVAYAHFLREEVAKRHEITSSTKGLGYIEYLKNESKKRP
jgi:hypothetical protein